MFFVRPSKYRHVFGTPAKRDQVYDNIRVSKSAWDTNLVKVNPLFVAINIEASGGKISLFCNFEGGAFTVLNHSNTGKLNDSLAVFNGHAAAVLDTDFNPFNDHVIASASVDCKVMIWKIPEGGLTDHCNTPVVSLAGHGRKVGRL